MTDWRRLIRATVGLAHRDGTRLRQRPVNGLLVFKPVGRSTNRSAKHVRGIVTGAWALSAENCQRCGGPVDPVSLGHGRGTRCRECREPGDRVVPRPAWRRKRETGHEGPGLLEEFVDAQDLADLMEARHTPATHRDWPVSRGRGDTDMRIVCPIAGAGCNHLLHGGVGVLSPLEYPGGPPPRRAKRIKARLGKLQVPPPPPDAVLRRDRRHSERRQRDKVHLLRPSRPHADTGMDAPGVRPMLDPRTAEPRAGGIQTANRSMSWSALLRGQRERDDRDQHLNTRGNASARRSARGARRRRGEKTPPR